MNRNAPLTSLNAGNNYPVTARDLPFAWFDWIFRRHGVIMPFLLLVLRWAVSFEGTTPRWDRDTTWRGSILGPCVMYTAQAIIRGLIYQLHYSGKLARDAAMVCIDALTTAS